MSNMKRFWEQVCIEMFGVVTPEYLERSRPVAQARIQGTISKRKECDAREQGCQVVSAMRGIDVPSEMD